MNFWKILLMRMTNILPILLIMLLTGCTTTSENVIVRTEYVRVEVPVVYKSNRPARPIKAGKSAPEYLSDVLTYTETLETIID